MDLVAYSANQFTSLVSPKIQVLDAAEGIHLWVLGILMTLKALGNETGGSYSLCENEIPAEAGIPLHIHTQEEETWYMLEGELEWTVGKQSFTVSKGSFINLPRFVQHSFRNKSDKPASMVVTYAPGGFEMFFLDVGVPVADRYNPGKPPQPRYDDLEKIIAISRRYGIFPGKTPKSDEG